MKTTNISPVDYYLTLSSNEIHLNQFLGKGIQIEYLNEINCIKCGRKTSKSFSQGFCYPCFKTAPETEECVLRPELCRAHKGFARDMEFAKTHCLIDHFVYISLTSGIKVGVTRNTQIPTRWIDQGATQALIIAKTPNRYLAGKIEVDLKKYMADKTNWRNMLTGKIDADKSIFEVKESVASVLSDELRQYLVDEKEITTIHYPLLSNPVSVKSTGFEKTTSVSGILTGIKGQYIIFDNERVLNIRKFSGYKVKMKIE